MKFLLHVLCLALCAMISSSSFLHTLCHESERLALLQFKQSFTINGLASTIPFAYPKTESWKPVGKGNDCCLWDGVKCDDTTGNVISLDLSSSCLYGSIRSNSSLFNLVHLQTLNLADNDFVYSFIPSKIGHLSNLKYLNLSQSRFSGQVPTELFALSMMVSLDLSLNYDSLSQAPLLQLHESSLEDLVRNFTSLKLLHLSTVKISSQLPKIMANLTSLTSLALRDCELNGVFPNSVFLLPNLQFLDVGYNEDLAGSLPKFLNGSKLEVLRLMNTRFFGEIPNSISNLGSLRAFSISNASFQGLIPHTLGELNQLKYLDLSSNHFEGLIPDSLGNLSQLINLCLHTNQLIGQIPPSLANLTQLTLLELSSNNFRGAIPTWISALGNLTKLNLQMNNFVGAIEFSMFLELKQLVFLGISGVDLIMPYETHDDDTYPQFQNLELRTCNLNHFPDFLRIQKNLKILYLVDNDIRGPIPHWVWNMSKETLLDINVDNNALTSFGKHPNILPWVNLKFFKLHSNKLQGSFPLPSPFLSTYEVYGNELSGQIPPLICNATSLFWLDLSYNNLRGVIPPCLGNLSSSLTYLSLKQNNLEGPIPERFTASRNLKMIDLSSNQLKGGISRSLENCSSLRLLDLSHNLIEDVFPTWLGALPELRVLTLGSNSLHGVIPANNGFGFPKLRIIDLSNNGFTGQLPDKVFLDWHAMEAKDQGNASYMEDNVKKTSPGILWNTSYQYSITLTVKGKETKYVKLPNIFLFVDLSNNRFEGQIPESIGSLMGLQALNLSNNNLIGPIPPSLANLSNLECLDLSQNMLVGEIPQQLTKLTFLEIFNVSYNHLVGTIPQANQFGTFPNDSFQGNTGLCGSPLSKQCKKYTEQAQASEEDEDSSSLVEWIIISMGYVAGLVTGVILGHIITTEKHEWFVKTFGKKQHNIARKR